MQPVTVHIGMNAFDLQDLNVLDAGGPHRVTHGLRRPIEHLGRVAVRGHAGDCEGCDERVDGWIERVHTRVVIHGVFDDALAKIPEHTWHLRREVLSIDECVKYVRPKSQA